MDNKQTGLENRYRDFLLYDADGCVLPIPLKKGYRVLKYNCEYSVYLDIANGVKNSIEVHTFKYGEELEKYFAESIKHFWFYMEIECVATGRNILTTITRYERSDDIIKIYFF